MSPKTSISAGSTKAEIRCLAVLMAAMMWGFGLGLAGHSGTDFSQACSMSAAAVLCGFASWLTYHIVGRQNNGLLVIGLSLSSILRDSGTFWTIVATFLPLSIAMGSFFGLMARGLEAMKTRKHAPVLPGPLYDAQLDHPA